MSSHYLLSVSDLYCILCSYFILKNVPVHAAAAVNVKDESWNSDFDRPHDASEDDIDINNWSYLDQTAPSHDLLLDQDNNNSDGRDAVESKGNGAVESEQCFQDKDDDSAFVKDDDSAFVRDDDSAIVRNDDDSAFVEENDSAIVKDDDSAFVRDDSKLPKPSSSWSQPPPIINVEERSTEDKKTIPCGMTMKPSEEEQGEKLSECKLI
jgi:hypothetical protein